MTTLTARLKKTFPHYENGLLIVIFFYFLLRLVFYSFSIVPDISPDEMDHVRRGFAYFQQNSIILPDTPETYRWELDSSFPFLYHLLLGKLYYLNFFHIPKILYFRFINMVCSIFTAAYGYRLMKLVTRDTGVSLLGLIVLTNIPMFSFLSSFVSYDNFCNLLSVLSIYNLFLFLKRRNLNNIFYFLIYALLGSLTKVSFLPLFCILFLIALFEIIKNGAHKDMVKQSTNVFKKPSTTIGITLVLILSVVTIWFYASNMKQYGALQPGCTQVLSYEHCLERPAFQAHIRYHQQFRQIDPSRLLTPYDFIFPWLNTALRGTFGIFGHRLMFRSTSELLPYYLLIVLFLVLFIRYFKFSDNKLLSYFVLIIGFYMAFLFFKFSYPTYRQIGIIEGSIHGRYLFPVIIPIVTLLVQTICLYTKKIPQWIIFLVIATVFVWGDLPYFVKKADKTWYCDTNLINCFSIRP
ncbi:MAG: hypothetical protein ABIJ41_00775 [Candidatus Omnitrophota bacterium]